MLPAAFSRVTQMPQRLLIRIIFPLGQVPPLPVPPLGQVPPLPVPPLGQVPPLPVPPLTEDVSDDTPPVDLQFNRFSRRL